MHHLGQNNNYNDGNTIKMQCVGMEQLTESFQGLKSTNGPNSPMMDPKPNVCTNQPPEGPESADSAEEGELRPSPINKRKATAAKQQEGEP